MQSTLEETNGVRVAIEGCGHGTLLAIYASVAESCKRKGWPGVDIVIICGDFQSVRNAYDLNCTSMPAKYLEMGDFYQYYSDQRRAPYLTLFVGGNHEASNHLFELYYGGWVAPNIYYLGAANVLRIGPLRIAGQSGIWKYHSYRKSHYERLPYNDSDIKTIYDVRELDTRKLLQIRTQVDIGLSHDWPRQVEWYGDWQQLFRFKQHLEPDARKGQLGSVAAQEVLKWLRPPWWFSAHLHCKYAAVVPHVVRSMTGGENQTTDVKHTGHKNGNGHGEPKKHLNSNAGSSATIAAKNTEEIDLDLGDDSNVGAAVNKGVVVQSANQDEIKLDLDDDTSPPAARSDKTHSAKGTLDDARAILPDSFRRPAETKTPEQPASITNTTTQFLALDKCLPGRHFLQLLEIPVESSAALVRPLRLEYDREWLAITRTFALDEPLVLGDPRATIEKARDHADYAEYIDKRRLWIDDKISDEDLVIPHNFEITAPVYDGGDWSLDEYKRVPEVPNPQTAQFCKMLDIPNPFQISAEEIERRLQDGPKPDPRADQANSNRGRGGFRGSRGDGFRSGRGGGFRGRYQPH